MKLVIALIEPVKMPEVRQALFNVGVDRMTITDVLGCGQQKGFNETYRGVVHEVDLLKKIRFEVAVNDDFVETTIDAILQSARSGNNGEVGDGKIFVMDLPECIRIRDGVRGGEAIG